MAITPVSGNIYVNQNTPAAASVQSDFQSKLELQSLAASTLAEQKKKEIEEIRPTEETYKIDPQNEHEKQKSKEELKEMEDDEKEEKDESEEEDLSEHRLNIVV
ncbi:hypothetical protein CIG11343_0170 [Campylobacter iguaniorum]|uniref:hypothetical protein n=1 Tax=Campylobacter iguaniorum TaxID=1244531 RepID=UPI0007C994D0|nr:hypothetical protein [Campylobacter iguaniorum]ANE35262.1 hypothetical protein CIG11343_0170 [Campylobacter iguaniorum]